MAAAARGVVGSMGRRSSGMRMRMMAGRRGEVVGKGVRVVGDVVVVLRRRWRQVAAGDHHGRHVGRHRGHLPLLLLGHVGEMGKEFTQWRWLAHGCLDGWYR